mgnify:FL=1|tara:strand:+ start:1639 stop:1878 length:240 start_codon:yes stop_codon:yes gene_type:complete
MGSFSDSTNYYGSNVIQIGSRITNSAIAHFWNGSIDEVRILKGIARWTAKFTPPTTSYISSTRSGLYFKDENGTVTPII